MNIPENEANKFKQCIKCIWNKLKGISNATVMCSMMSCDISKKADKYIRPSNDKR